MIHTIFALLFTKIAMDRRGSQGWTRVLLKGQMRYVSDMDAIIFLCSPLYVVLKLTYVK